MSRNNFKIGDLCFVSDRTYNIHGYIINTQIGIILSLPDKHKGYFCLVKNKIMYYPEVFLSSLSV